MSADGLGSVPWTRLLSSELKFLLLTPSTTLLIFRGRLGYGEEKRADPYNKDMNDV